MKVHIWICPLLPSRAAILLPLCARYLGLEEREVCLSETPTGKPVLGAVHDPARLHFSVTHSKQFLLVAFLRDRAVGIDLEFADREVRAPERLVERFYSAAEKKHFANIPASDRRHAFLSSWTKKEALIKARGERISDGLGRFGADFLGDEPTFVFRGPGQNEKAWLIQRVRVPGVPEHFCHLAVEGEASVGVEFKEWVQRGTE